jgi:hypothetical protein
MVCRSVELTIDFCHYYQLFLFFLHHHCNYHYFQLFLYLHHFCFCHYYPYNCTFQCTICCTSLYSCCRCLFVFVVVCHCRYILIAVIVIVELCCVAVFAVSVLRVVNCCVGDVNGVEALARGGTLKDFISIFV